MTNVNAVPATGGDKMKITKRQLRRIIHEELIKQSSLTELFGPNWEEEAANLDEPPPITKVGDLRKLIKALQSEKRSKTGMKGLADISQGIVTDLVPGAGTALSVASTLKAMYSAPDDKKTNTYLDRMNVDDEVAAIVDDTVEDNFLIKAMELIEGLPDDADIPDINQELSKWLKSKYEARTVVGFEEGKRIKITKRQLRRIIKEERLKLEGFADEVDQLLYDALDAEIGMAIQTVINETGADPNLPAVRSTIARALNDYIARNYR